MPPAILNITLDYHDDLKNYQRYGKIGFSFPFSHIVLGNQVKLRRYPGRLCYSCGIVVTCLGDITNR